MSRHGVPRHRSADGHSRACCKHAAKQHGTCCTWLSTSPSPRHATNSLVKVARRCRVSCKTVSPREHTRGNIRICREVQACCDQKHWSYHERCEGGITLTVCLLHSYCTIGLCAPRFEPAPTDVDRQVGVLLVATLIVAGSCSPTTAQSSHRAHELPPEGPKNEAADHERCARARGAQPIGFGCGID
jgi:hypothetical protein